jgi:hypothetical protein
MLAAARAVSVKIFFILFDFKLAGELLFRFAHPGYKKANGAVDLTRVC